MTEITKPYCRNKWKRHGALGENAVCHAYKYRIRAFFSFQAGWIYINIETFNIINKHYVFYRLGKKIYLPTSPVLTYVNATFSPLVKPIFFEFLSPFPSTVTDVVSGKKPSRISVHEADGIKLRFNS